MGQLKQKYWKDSFIIQTYELAKEGNTAKQIAKTLGIGYQTFRRYALAKPALKLAYKKGKRVYKANSQGDAQDTFINYVAGRLSPRLRKLYRQILQFEKARTAPEKIEALLHNKGIRVRQLIFLHALVCSRFQITVACRRANVSYHAIRTWKNKDPYFLELLDEITWHRKNFFEDSLCSLVAQGDPITTRFVNETYNADRGYRKQIQMKVEETHTEEHIVRIEDLDLTLEQQREILYKARAKQVDSQVINTESSPSTTALPEPQTSKRKRRARRKQND